MVPSPSRGLCPHTHITLGPASSLGRHEAARSASSLGRHEASRVHEVHHGAVHELHRDAD